MGFKISQHSPFNPASLTIGLTTWAPSKSQRSSELTTSNEKKGPPTRNAKTNQQNMKKYLKGPDIHDIQRFGQTNFHKKSDSKPFFLPASGLWWIVQSSPLAPRESLGSPVGCGWFERCQTSRHLHLRPTDPWQSLTPSSGRWWRQ